MIAALALAFAADDLQTPIYTEPLVGTPRVCVSFLPEQGPFKKKDAKVWAKLRRDMEKNAPSSILRRYLGELKKEHPAARSVELALQVADEKVTLDPEMVVAFAPEDPCVLQTAMLAAVTTGNRESALAYLEKLNQVAPEAPDVVLLSTVFQPEGDFTAHREKLEGAVAKAPRYAALRLIAGRAALDAGDLKAGIEHFQVAYELGVSDVAEPLFHLRRMAGDREGYLAQAATMELPMDAVDFDKARKGEETYVQAYERSLDIGEGEVIVATLRTTQGDIECQLHHRRAPVTVANFVGLAKGLQATEVTEKGTPYYDGLVFHRVIPTFMIQGGDPEGTGKGGPGYRFIDELEPSLGFDGPGVLAMANSGPATNGSQFFVTEVATPHLSGLHTIFGQCTPESVEVVKAIARTDARHDRPVEDVVIQSVEFASTTPEGSR